MKQRYFIKFDPNIKRLTGCDRATLILEKLEFFFSKQPDGFYKFIEPCSHRLYKKYDSWSEELGCDRKCFTRSWDKIGFRHRSRGAFEAAEDKFEGKLYASYYDRHINQMFFVRNHDLANETLKEFYGPKKEAKKQKATLENNENTQTEKTTDSLALEPLSIGHSVCSYIEAKNTSDDLSKDKSHAGNETVKKMVDIWTAIVQEGKGQIELKGRIIPFLKRAFIDQFSSCLQKWKEYCISIARSKFLMGEKTSFKATLDWALKFDVISKILSGDSYGIGDRSRTLTPEELEALEKKREEQQKAKELEQQRSRQTLEEEIKNRLDEQEPLKNFRIKWLHRFGEQSYKEFLADCAMKIGEKENDLIIYPQERMIAKRLESYWEPELLSDQPFNRIQIYHCIPDFMGKPLVFDRWLGDVEEVEEIEQGEEKSVTSANSFDKPFDKPIDESQSVESNQLRAKLKERIPAKEYPVWLNDVKVQEIKPDGTLVVTFKGRITAVYARRRFSGKILEAAMDLWSEVTDLVIYEESDNLSAHDGNDRLEIDERTLVKQAIQSLMGVCLAGAGQKRGITTVGHRYRSVF